MNSAIAFCFGPVVIYWSGIVIACGVFAGFLLAYSLYTAHSGRGSDMWILFAFAMILGVFFSRLLHVLSNPEQYENLPRAFFDGSQGSFWLPGAVLALVPAAILAKRFGAGASPAELLDAAAPGAALAVAFIRFSALFTNACRSVFSISSPAFQHYPFAAPAPYTDASGDLVWHFASFFVMAVAMLLVTVALVAFYIRCHGEKTKMPCSLSCALSHPARAQPVCCIRPPDPAVCRYLSDLGNGVLHPVLRRGKRSTKEAETFVCAFCVCTSWLYSDGGSAPPGGCVSATLYCPGALCCPCCHRRLAAVSFVQG